MDNSFQKWRLIRLKINSEKLFIPSIIYNEFNQGCCQGELVEPVALIETRLQQAQADNFYNLTD